MSLARRIPNHRVLAAIAFILIAASPAHTDDKPLDAVVLKKVKAATAAIDDGSMVVPATADQLKSFQPTAK